MADKKNHYQQASLIVVNNDHAGRRLDNFLISHFANLPKSRIYQMIRKGEVRVNKGRRKQHYHLQIGDSIRLPPVYFAIEKFVYIPVRLSQLISDSIIHEDDSLIVINKPANIAVHGGTNVCNGVIDILRKQRSNECFLELVHRLDKATSGCLMIAKNHVTLRCMHSLLQNGQLKKNYLTLIKGHLEDTVRTVDLPIYITNKICTVSNHDINSSKKSALTHFWSLKRFSSTSLVRVELMTGRKHQIRVHAQSIGHPLAGDDKYGDFAFNQSMKHFSLKRLFLHAHTLSFAMPNTGKSYKFTAPLPDELQECLNKLA